MAEYRPYRMVDEAARWQLHRFKLVVFAAFVALSLLINWFITERVAQLLGRGPGLGATLMFGLHDPWDWALWWYRWRDNQDLQLLWASCLHTAAYGMVAGRRRPVWPWSLGACGLCARRCPTCMDRPAGPIPPTWPRRVSVAQSFASSALAQAAGQVRPGA